MVTDFNALLNCLGLNQVTDAPIGPTQRTYTSIDLILVTNDANVAAADTVSVQDLYDHDLGFYELPTLCVKSEVTYMLAILTLKIMNNFNPI